MNKLALLCFKSATLFLVVGILIGIFMAASHDHTVTGAHAHNNLLGWVTLAIFGIYYQFNPTKAESKLALAQVWLHIVAVIIMIISLAALLYGNPAFEVVVAISSLVVLVDVIIFTYLVFKA